MPPAGGRGRRGSAVPQARERLWIPGSAGCFVQRRAQLARTERACGGSAKEPARRAAARPPSGFVRRSARARKSPRALERRGAPRPPTAGAESVGKAATRWRQKEQASVSREGSHQAKAGERALRGSSEPSGRIVSFHQAPRLLPPS